MKHNFDEIINRSKTACAKYSPKALKMQFNGHDDLLPMWVADMDFASSKAILKELQKTLDERIFGYTMLDDKHLEAIIGWYERKHNFKLEKDWIVFTAGVVATLNFLVQEFTKKGESVLIQPPVYYPFKNAIVNNERKLVLNPLIEKDGHYSVDFMDMEKKIVENEVKLFILCSPHNPVGRVWSKDELKKMGELCLKHKVLVIADEIHHDLVLFDNKHIMFASISEDFAQNSITCTAPSKTFNLAGMQASNIIIKNKELKKRYESRLTKLGLHNINAFGPAIMYAAYAKSDDWYEELLIYLGANFKYLQDFFKKHLPKLKVTPLEGTYLVWIDARALNFSNEELSDFLELKAKLGVDHGFWFGKEGEGFFRINIACPRATLDEGLNRLKNALA